MAKRKLKKGVKFSLIGILLLVIAAAGIFTATKMNVFAEKQADIEDLDVKVSDTKDEQFEQFTFKTDQLESEKYPFEMIYPQSESQSFNRAAKQFAQKIEQQYVTQVIDKRLEDKTAVGSLTSTVQPIADTNDNGLAVVTTTTITGDKTNSETQHVQAFQVNEETGALLSIQDVIVHDKEALQTLATTVEQALKNQEGAEKIQDVALFPQPKWNHFSNFALTKETINFYFNDLKEGQAPVISIKRSDINDILQDDFKGYTVDPSKKMVALTFDDGPSGEVTPDVLATLEKYNAKATFFMLGQQVKAYPELTKEIAERGHEIGNHSWSHPVLPSLSDARIKEEVLNTNAIIKETIGSEPTVFRPPYGAVNDKVRKHLTSPVILWDVDTLDWKHRNPAQLLSIVQTYTHDRSIILMHDIHRSTADGLDAVMKVLHDQGYQFVTVSELRAVEAAENNQ